MTEMEQALNALREDQKIKHVEEKHDTKIAEMNELAATIVELRDKEKEASNAKKVVTAQLEIAENRALALLEGHGLKQYRAPSCLLSLAFLTSAQTPKTPESKAALFQYLKSINRYDDMVSVNSQTLNSFYKEQLELAKERGEDDLKIPGITEVKVLPRLSVTRPK